ncbi:hypothetical protein [Devosia sp. CN2-171]|uniref:hypothetical protein n=1 Tax=Devosia sp. CN2-171 TaxID=3400909 RepID=UPI003BF8DFD8
MGWRVTARKLLSSQAALAATTVLASFLGIALNLCLPFLLHAEEYARYSLLLGFAQVTASLLFEWLRIGVIRYSQTSDPAADQDRRSVMAAAYLAVSGALGVLAVAFALLSTLNAGFSPVALVAAIAALQGIFDGQQAASRASFLNFAVSSRTILRAVLGLVGAVAGGLLFGTGEATLIGFALAYPLSSFFSARRQLTEWSATPPKFAALLPLVRFGVLAATGTNLSIAIPAALRSVIVGSVGLGEAGGLLLIVDLAQRTFSTIGTSINVVTVQNAIRAHISDRPERLHDALRPHLVLLAASGFPFVLCYLTLAPQILGGSFLPESYRGGFGTSGLLLMLAIFVMTVRQYSIDSLFVVFGRSLLAPVGAVTTLALLIAAAPAVTLLHPSTAITMTALLAASVVGTAAAIFCLVATAKVPWPFRDLWLTLAAALLVTLPAWLFAATIGPFHALLLSAGLGLVYLALLAVGDVAGSRAVLASVARWVPRRSRG